MKTFSYESMGTHWEISIYKDSHCNFKEIEKEIVAMSQEFDQTYSRFIRTSLVWKIAEKAGTYEVPQDFINMLQLYRDLYKPSGKKLNPLVGFTISDLGYDDQYSLVAKDTIRKTPDLFETVKLHNGDHCAIETTEPVLFDFGALGKGYFVDKITDYLKEKGIEHFLVNGSGDIYYYGDEPIEVGLEHPDNPSLVIGKMLIKNGAMCASGINRRKWGKHHHVIDPHKNASRNEDIKATWVIAQNAALSDALASCLFFAPPENFATYSFEYVIMNSENAVKVSHDWNVELY